jgi:transketolase
VSFNSIQQRKVKQATASSVTFAKAIDPPTLEELCISTLCFLAVDTVQKVKSGHPGLPIGSAGHGGALLYALLHVTGFDLPLDELKMFRQ